MSWRYGLVGKSCLVEIWFEDRQEGRNVIETNGWKAVQLQLSATRRMLFV
jgi:hypothetical protein